VTPQNFNLSHEEILEAEDADLNEFISLRKLAPYRSMDKLQSDEQKWKKSKKKKLWEFKSKLKGKEIHKVVVDVEESYNAAGARLKLDQDRMDAYIPKKKRKY
jgi:protein KRI1